MDLLGCTLDQISEVAVDEAIRRLGLLQPSARPAILAMLKDDEGRHPRAICTAYRKTGKQLSKNELKALGLRTNSFMSREALGEITEAGMDAPLDAHVTTLLRSHFTVARWRTLLSVEDHIRQGVVKREAVLLKYDMLAPHCECCRRLDGAPTTPDTAHILPADDCQCDTANYAIQLRIDFLCNLD